MTSFQLGLDRTTRRSCPASRLFSPCSADRLTSLPDELLTRILEMLPTKDAATAQVVSKRMRRAFFWISSIDLDDSIISHCVEHPHLVERFPLFESFVDNVLHKLSQSPKSLTRFRLHLGGDITNLAFSYYYNGHKCEKACCPNPKPSRIYAWISYPLAHCGLKELDLSFHVRNPHEYKIPPELFVCQSLEVLRLGFNLEISNDSGIPVICLPNLKLLHLHSFEFGDDEFVTRLVSHCPALEDLSITYCWWLVMDRVIISSHSIRRLHLVFYNYHSDCKNSDLVLLDTPNLQYFKYIGNLPYEFSVAHLNPLVEAFILLETPWYVDDNIPAAPMQPLTLGCVPLLSLARALSNVQDLSLHGCCLEIFFFAAEFKDQLPMFHSLKILKLDSLIYKFASVRMDIVLLLILHCSPVLETLVFPKGFFEHIYSDWEENMEAIALEIDGWKTIETIPSCCKSHLKRIVTSYCCGCDQELNMIKFLLGNTSVLKEFVICLPYKPCKGVRSEARNFDQYQKTLEELPRASNSCSIIYCNERLYDFKDF